MLAIDDAAWNDVLAVLDRPTRHHHPRQGDSPALAERAQPGSRAVQQRLSPVVHPVTLPDRQCMLLVRGLGVMLAS